MQAVSQSAQDVLEVLTKRLDWPNGSSRKLDHGGAGIMAVHVERIGPSTFSVAHYYEAGGDLVCDPDMVFFRQLDASFCPMSFEMGGVCYQPSMELHAGRPVITDAKAYAEQLAFVPLWMENILGQQGAGDVRTLRERVDATVPGVN